MVWLQQQNYKTLHTQTARYNSWAAVQHRTVPTMEMETHCILLLLFTAAGSMSLCGRCRASGDGKNMRCHQQHSRDRLTSVSTRVECFIVTLKRTIATWENQDFLL